MVRSCAVILLLALSVLEVRGDEGVTNSVTDEAPPSPTPLNPPSAMPSMDLPHETLGNGMVPGESHGIISDNQELSAPPMPSSLEILVPRETEEVTNGAALEDNMVKAMAEEMQGSPREVPLSEQKLIRRKRTFSKHKGCMICGMIPKMIMKHPMFSAPQTCHSCQQQPMYHPPPPPPPPPPQQYCDPCQQKQQHYAPPPPPPPQHPCGGGGGCGGAPMGGGWSHSQSSAQSSASSGSWGKKK